MNIIKHKHTSKHRQASGRQGGMTLLEIMIALGIGSVVIASILSMYVNALESAAYQNSSSRVQENGRFAIDHIARSLRMARYDDPQEVTTTAIIPGLYGTTSADNAVALTGFTLKSGTDAIQISHEGSDSVVDCHGVAVAATTWATNTYAISDNDELLCGTGTAAALVIAEGVEDLELTYGVDSDADGIANQYLVESAISTADWSNVVVVRIAVLVNSVETVFANTLHGCESCSTFNPTANNQMRGEFHTTVRIRNL